MISNTDNLPSTKLLMKSALFCIFISLVLTISVYTAHSVEPGRDICGYIDGQIDWQKVSPLDYLDILKEMSNCDLPFVSIAHKAPLGWIKEVDVHILIELIDSKEPAAYTISALSSYIPLGHSTVGKEAAFIIQGFISGEYPPTLGSSGANPSYVRQWYRQWSRDHESSESAFFDDDWQVIRPLLGPKFLEVMQIEGTLSKYECPLCKAQWNQVFIEVLPEGRRTGIRKIRLLSFGDEMDLLAKRSARVRLVGYETLDINPPAAEVYDGELNLFAYATTGARIENVFVALQSVATDGPYPFTGRYEVEITGAEMESDDLMCKNHSASGGQFRLTESQVRLFFKKATVITSIELHDEYDVLPCYVHGYIYDSKDKYKWEIRPIGIGKLITPDDEVIWLGCKEDCEEMF